MSATISLLAIDWFRVKADETVNEAVRRSQQQAIDLLQKFSGGETITFEDIDENLLNGWVAWNFYHGYSHATVTTYLGRLSALYGKAVKDGLARPSECFTGVKERLKNLSPDALEVFSIKDCFGRLRRLVLADYSKNPALQLAKDIVLFSLYNGGLAFEKLANFQKDGYQGDDEAVSAIVRRYAKPKNKYLFPLNQSERTPRQLDRAVSALFCDALKQVGITLSDYNTETPVNLWALVAMHCGVPSDDIASCVSHADTPSIFSFAAKQDIPQARKTEIQSRIAKILAKDPEDWYAMQFRPHVTYDRLRDRMDSLGIEFIRSFYPMETIVRRIGGKIKQELRPVTPGLLFFRSKAAEVPELFMQIGDLAWGYRYTRDIRSPYAVIPGSAIEKYEQAIGKFVDFVDAYPQGHLKLESGDKVEIIGGQFAGYPAVFEKEIREIDSANEACTQITCRLKLVGMDNFSWSVNLDPRMMTRISDDRFELLVNNKD